MKKRVVVGMSGGVDSSVACYLLKEQGYDVIGVTLRLAGTQDETLQLQGGNGGCLATGAIEDAASVAKLIGVPYHVVDFHDEFREHVIKYFVEEYCAGRTPNPCVVCNRYVKWESLLHAAQMYGADYVATGHYAQVMKMENGRFTLRRSVTTAKDQTYALYRLSQEQLRVALMPVGKYTKDQIRAVAEKIGLGVAHKPDSQEICFIPDNDYVSFLQRFTGQSLNPGNFVTMSGEVLGRHEGIECYTVGQRKGLGAFGKAVYVVAIRPEQNEVVLGDNEAVFSRSLIADKLNYMAVDDFSGIGTVTAKIRYSHGGAVCRVSMTGPDRITCDFVEPQRAITPGQSVVLYDGDVVLGGGTIAYGI